MASILFTGFEPFGGMGSNPSWDGLALAQQTHPEAFEEIALVALPVTWQGSAGGLDRALEEHQPKLVISFGMHGGTDSSGRDLRTFYFERSAYNLNDAPIADNAGDLRSMHAIQPEAPQSFARATPLDPQPWLGGLKHAGFAAGVSDDPGRFVCNHLFFHALRMVESYYHQMQAGFIHVPPGAENREGSLTLEEFGKAYVTLARIARHLVALDDPERSSLRRG